MNDDDLFSANPFAPVSCDFSSLLFSSKFSDFTLNIPNTPADQKKTIPVHRFILDACSEFFHDFFLNNPRERNLTIYFPDWAAIYTIQVIKYLYTSESLKITGENCAAVYLIAVTWGIKKLIEKTRIYLSRKIDGEFALYALNLLADYIYKDEMVLKCLTKLIGSKLQIHSADQFAQLPFEIIDMILNYAYKRKPGNDIINSICDIITHYTTANIQNISKNDFEKLVQHFSMKTNHSGITELYKLAIRQNYSLQTIENKILHSWLHLNQEELAQLPLPSLEKFLKTNYINANSEDDLFDFALTACKYHTGEDLTQLWAGIRPYSLTDECRLKFENCQIVPEVMKTTERPSSDIRRLPCHLIRCLVLGAADDTALDDVKNSLINTGFLPENIITARGDRPLEADLESFNVVLVFGFYKFYNPSFLSSRLASYSKSAGGLVIAYGAHRPDSFGIGEPLSTLLPVSPGQEIPGLPASPHAECVQKKGCRHKRMLCRAKEGAIVDTIWDDGVPFIIRAPQNQHRGGIVVLNAVPVTSNIVSQQWRSNDHYALHHLMNAIVSVASIPIMRRSSSIKNIIKNSEGQN